MSRTRASNPAGALLLVAACAAGGCNAPKTSDRNLVLVDPAEAIKLSQEHKTLLGLGPKTTAAWVDPRSEAEYEAGHIPGAISMPFQTVTSEYRKLRGYHLIIVYGRDYNDEKADGMSKRLMELGLKDVRTLRGGLRAWVADGQEIAAGAEP